MSRILQPDQQRRLRAARERLERAISGSEVACREEIRVRTDAARRTRDAATYELLHAARVFSLVAKELGY